MAGNVGDVDRMTTAYYTSVNAEERQAAHQQLEEVMQNIGTLLHVMEDSDCEYSQTFLTLSIVPSFRQQKATLSPELIQELLGRVLNRIFSPESNSFTGHSMTALVLCMAQLTKLCFESEATMNERVIDDCLGLLARDSNNRADPSSPQFHAAVEVLMVLVMEFNLYESKKASTYLSFVQHRRASNAFRDKCLQNILGCALQLLEASEGPLEKICELVKNCLNYDFMAILVDETEESMTVQFPGTWKEGLLGDWTMALWQKHLELPLPYCTTLLQALSGIFGCRRSLFDDQKSAFIDRCLQHVTQIERCTDGRHNDSEYCGVLAEAIVRLTPPFAYRDMIDCQSYDGWLDFVANFSLKVFNIPFGNSGSMLSTCTLLTFWSRIINSRKMYFSGAPIAYGVLLDSSSPPKEEKEQRDDLEKYCPTLAGTLFQCRLTTRGNSDFDSDSLESIIAQAELFPALCNVDPANTILSLIQAAENIGGPDIANNDDSFTWLMYLCGSIVRSCLTQHADRAGTVLGALLELCVGAVNARQSSGRRNSDTVESSIVFFLSSVQAVLSSRHLSEQAQKIRDHAFGSVTGVFQFILTATGHNMLNPSSDAIQIARQSINLIAEAARDAPTQAKKQLTFNLPPVVEMPLSLNKETYKLRTPLNNALLSLAIQEPYEQDQLLTFLQPIENMMQASASGAGEMSMEPLFIGGWLRDLRGVAEAAAEMQAVFTDFVDWVVERADVFYSLSNMNQADPIIVTSLLRFINQMVTPSRGGKVNLPSACHCPSGVILFKFVAQAVQNVITTNLTSQNMSSMLRQQPLPDGAYTVLLKPLLLSMVICKQCITGEFCPFGAMAMYNDTTFDNLVSGLCGFLQDFPVILFQQYQPAGVAFSELMKTMVEAQVVSPMALMDQASLGNLIRMTIELVDDAETKTPVLLNCLSFLSYFGGLKRIVQRQQSGQPPSPTLSPTKSSAKHNETIATMLHSYGTEFWWEIVRASMAVVVDQERGLSAVNQIVFQLFEVDTDLWNQYCTHLANQYPQDKQAKVQEGLEILRQAGGGPQDKFFSAMFQFRSHLRTI